MHDDDGWMPDEERLQRLEDLVLNSGRSCCSGPTLFDYGHMLIQATIALSAVVIAYKMF